MSERNVADVIREWREWQRKHLSPYAERGKTITEADADAELVSRINYWAETQRPDLQKAITDLKEKRDSTQAQFYHRQDNQDFRDGRVSAFEEVLEMLAVQR